MGVCFAYNIVLIDEISEVVNQKLELWRNTLESKGFRISSSKTEYMQCKFSQHEKSEVEVRLNGIAVPKCKQFRYLGLFQENEIIDEDATHRIKIGWLKWRSVTVVLCDKMMPTRVKGKFYRRATRPAMLYIVNIGLLSPTYPQNEC